jgi:hypothetical protein
MNTDDAIERLSGAADADQRSVAIEDLFETDTAAVRDAFLD